MHEPTSDTFTLDRLQPGQAASIRGIAPDIPASDRRRLLELGLFPGTPVTAVRRSPLGDPIAYEVRGMVVALRRDQARFIQVDRAGLEDVRR